MTPFATDRRPVWGLTAFLFAVLALIAVSLHVSDAFGPPEKSAATAIGEIAAEIRDSARRAMSGEAPPAPPAAAGWDAERALMLAVPLLAGVAAFLGAVGLFRREPPTLPALAIGMGGAAFAMQYLFWLALIIGGVCLLVAIIGNIDGILGG